MAQALIVGIDVGTTGVKAGLFDADGACLDTASLHYATHRPGAGLAEQDAGDWLRLVTDLLARMESAAGGIPVRAVGLTSQVNTHVFCDDELSPLAPAITWQDSRAAGEAATIDATLAEQDKLAWWGAPLPVDASHVLARIAWMADHRPDVWARTRHVLAPKDFVIARLTGTVSTDPMTAFGIVDQSLSLIDGLVARVPGAAERLPPVRGFTASAGTIKAGLPCAGAAMVTGAMDAWAGFIGAGAAEDGDCVLLSGTSDIIGIVSDTKVPTPGVIAFPRCEGLTIHAGPTQSGAASLDWIARILGATVDEVSALAASAGPDSATPIFLPHLDGERAPLWDPLSRGTFAGAHAASSRAEFALAVLEGVAYADRRLLEALEQSSGVTPASVRHAGGGSRSDIWCQIRADVLGRPIHRLATPDAGLAGAALMAGVGAGLFPSIRAAQSVFSADGKSFAPRDGLAARHDRRMKLAISLHGALDGFHRELAGGNA